MHTDCPNVMTFSKISSCLCSEKKKKKYRSGTKWKWVNNGRICVWTLPLSKVNKLKVLTLFFLGVSSSRSVHPTVAERKSLLAINGTWEMVFLHFLSLSWELFCICSFCNSSTETSLLFFVSFVVFLPLRASRSHCQKQKTCPCVHSHQPWVWHKPPTPLQPPSPPITPSNFTTASQAWHSICAALHLLTLLPVHPKKHIVRWQRKPKQLIMCTHTSKPALHVKTNLILQDNPLTS